MGTSMLNLLEFKRLLARDDVHHTQLAQCNFGPASEKPTAVVHFRVRLGDLPAECRRTTFQLTNGERACFFRRQPCISQAAAAYPGGFYWTRIPFHYTTNPPNPHSTLFSLLLYSLILKGLMEQDLSSLQQGPCLSMTKFPWLQHSPFGQATSAPSVRVDFFWMSPPLQGVLRLQVSIPKLRSSRPLNIGAGTPRGIRLRTPYSLALLATLRDSKT